MNDFKIPMNYLFATTGEISFVGFIRMNSSIELEWSNGRETDVRQYGYEKSMSDQLGVRKESQ